jgi:hypothetical protein
VGGDGHRDCHVEAGAVRLVPDPVTAELVDIAEVAEEALEQGGVSATAAWRNPVERLLGTSSGFSGACGRYGGIGPMSTARSICAGPYVLRYLVTSPVLADDPVAGREQDRELLVPGPAAERVAVDEDHRRTAAVVLVVKVDGHGVLGAEGDDGHGLTPGECVVAEPVRHLWLWAEQRVIGIAHGAGWRGLALLSSTLRHLGIRG